MSTSQNSYQSPSFSSAYAPVASEADTSERVAFIQRTYAHLAGAVLAFVGVEALLFTIVPEETLRNVVGVMVGGWGWLIVLGVFMAVSWLARSWASSGASTPVQYAGLGLYVLAQAAIFMPLMYAAVFLTNDQYVLPSAAIITLSVFAGLTIGVFVTRADFSWLRMALWLGGWAAMAVVACGIIMGFSLGIFFSLAMVVLASGYILYDTSNVLHHYRTTQHVAAALALFSSLALLFWYVLRIMMSLSRD